MRLARTLAALMAASDGRWDTGGETVVKCVSFGCQLVGVMQENYVLRRYDADEVCNGGSFAMEDQTSK